MHYHIAINVVSHMILSDNACRQCFKAAFPLWLCFGPWAMKKQMAGHDVVLNSTSGSDEEEKEVVVVEEEQSRSVDVESGTSSAILSADAMMSKFIEMSCQSAEMIEQQRTLQLMAKKKSARAALSFEPPPPQKTRKLPTPFLPKRSEADSMSPTQADDDFERDFLASHLSRTIAWKRLTDKLVLVETMFTDEKSPAECEISTELMTQSGEYEDIEHVDKAYGGFK
jgi:hypothetical protein